MKTIFFSLVILLITFTTKAQDFSTAPQLERREQVMYLKGYDTPYSGKYHLDYQNGKPFIHGQYLNGLKEGKWVVYDSLGNLRSEEFFIKDQWDGVRKTYHPNGKISTIENFKNGVRNGLQEGYHENGNLYFSVNQINGNKEGNWRMYHQNGKLLQKGKFKLDLAEGKWNVYDENGKVIEIQNFKGGELISSKQINK